MYDHVLVGTLHVKKWDVRTMKYTTDVQVVLPPVGTIRRIYNIWRNHEFPSLLLAPLALTDLFGVYKSVAGLMT